jgi:UDPglucose 6-dehydrogenase
LTYSNSAKIESRQAETVRPVHQPNCPPAATPDFVVATIASAELIKHASNSFLGLKISYANVLADLCDKLGAMWMK